MKNDHYFSDEYIQPSDTKSSDEKDMSTEFKAKVEIDTEKYGLAKPKRIIIRGRVINDQG